MPDSLAGSTVNLSIDFVAAARAVDLTARAEVVRRGRSLCFVEVEVVDPTGTVIAKSLATHRYG